jgi:flavin-dependent dehydrogenase
VTRASFDVVVAGGGPAGCAVALALARRGRSVLVVDPARGRGVQLGESLPPAARPLLAELGVLDRVAGAGHLPTHGTLSAWGSDVLVARDFVFELHGPGFQLDRARFDADLRACAREAGAAVEGGARVDGAEWRGERWEVSLAGAGAGAGAGAAVRVVDAAWLVDATGRGAALGRRLGARREHADALVAFAGVLQPRGSADEDSRLIVEACADGWWYSALCPGGARVVAFLTDRDLADARAWLSRAGFEARLAATVHLAPRLAAHGYALTGRPRGVSAASGHLAPWRGAGWLAVGDAALAFDPLSSQGIFHALYTGERAGRALAAALGGDESELAGYDRRLTEVRAAYLANRAAYYAAEPRWADRPFWRRRASAPAPAPAPRVVSPG